MIVRREGEMICKVGQRNFWGRGAVILRRLRERMKFAAKRETEGKLPCHARKAV